MPRTAKVFMTNRSQAVRLPKEFQFATDEVLIRKVGDDVILSPRPRDWKTYLTSAPPGQFTIEVEIYLGQRLVTVFTHGRSAPSGTSPRLLANSHNVLWSCFLPRCSRDITVPIGTSSISAISL